MNDRELLELAAKAAGIELQKRFMVENTVARIKDGWLWAPLTDDGDALRLAVKLGLDICIDTQYEKAPCTQAIGFMSERSTTTFDCVEHHGDPYAATRRAIVRAAAEIAKSEVCPAPKIRSTSGTEAEQ